MKNLFADGGVIGHNPSAIGGTWAYRIVAHDGFSIAEKSGVITPTQAEMPVITNNLTEMLAVIRALQAVPFDWTGTVCSDSQITLGRIFMGWKWKNIPPWMHHEFQAAVKRLVNWSTIGYCLLQGHPTEKELAAGVGHKGYPVSVHNKWCDEACGEAAADYLRRMNPVEVMA